MNNIFSYALYAFVIIGGLILFFQKRQQKSAKWTGVVTDKIANINYIRTPQKGTSIEDNIRSGNYVRLDAARGRSSFVLKIRTDEGKETHSMVSSSIYLNVAIGDRMTKAAGNVEPEILAKSAGSEETVNSSITPDDD